MTNRVRRVAIGLGVWALAGCMGGDPPNMGANTATLNQALGSWEMTTGGCRQVLTLEAGGTFQLSTRVVASNGQTDRQEQSVGTYQWVTTQGGPVIEFQSSAKVPLRQLSYCAQWSGRTETQLPFSSVLAQTGLDLSALGYREDQSPLYGPFWVGRNANGDQFVLYWPDAAHISGLTISGLMAAMTAQGMGYIHPLFSTSEGEANHRLSWVNGNPVVNVPLERGGYSQAGAPKNTVLKSMVLNISAAADVTFSIVPQGGVLPCEFRAYQDTGFMLLRAGFFQAGAASQTLRLNPGDPTQAFLTQAVTAPDGTVSTAYLLPVQVYSTNGGDCAASIEGASLVSVFLGQVGGAVTPVMSPQVVDGTWYLSGPQREYPAQMELISFRPGASWHGFNRFSGLLVGLVPLPSASGFDLLGFGGGGGTQVALQYQGGPQETLSLLPSGGGMGLGGFHRVGVPTAPVVLDTGLGLPLAYNGTFALAGDAHVLRLRVGSASRLAVWSEGTGGALLDTYGELVDSHGVLVARSEAAGAGRAGFLFRRTLPAGDYQLTVTGRQAGGYTLRVAAAAPLAVTDERLETCLLEQGLENRVEWNRVRYHCPRENIQSLTGMNTYPHSWLHTLDLAENRIVQLQPLAGFSSLRRLYLAGNQITDPSPLAALGSASGAGVTGLEVLDLGNNPLDSTKLASLAGLGTTLKILDLRGASSLSPQAVNALKAAMPKTLIIAPDGTWLK
ncbi:MAG: hypothetical protein OEV94_07530 [Deltaproteobacteria bacterium]|nr:hypothetical protein [Deltaproteobacteria bacterium]